MSGEYRAPFIIAYRIVRSPIRTHANRRNSRLPLRLAGSFPQKKSVITRGMRMPMATTPTKKVAEELPVRMLFIDILVVSDEWREPHKNASSAPI
jgi:hypothetical protein